MNTLNGIITGIKSENGFSLINLECKGQKMKSIIINHEADGSGFQVNQSVQIMFKETEVFIGKGWDHSISLRNQLKGTIQSIVQGKILAEINILTESGMICSVITSDAVNSLNLKKDDKVTAMIKTNEVLLSH